MRSTLSIIVAPQLALASVSIVSVLAQPTQTHVYQADGLEFAAKMIDTLYRFGDTISISYDVHNYSDLPVYVFDPSAWHFVSDTLRRCERTFDLGGKWQLELGYEQPLPLRKLNPNDSLKHAFRVICAVQDSCAPTVLDGYIPADQFKQINIVPAYVFKLKRLSTSPLPADTILAHYDIDQWQDPRQPGLYEAPSSAIALEFELSLERFSLGPFIIALRH